MDQFWAFISAKYQ